MTITMTITNDYINNMTNIFTILMIIIANTLHNSAKLRVVNIGVCRSFGNSLWNSNSDDSNN